MATLKSNKVTANAPARDLPSGVLAVVGTYALGAALALNDVIQMVTVPAGATILDVLLAVTDLDTGGSPAIVLTVGDGGDTDRFVTASTVGQAGGVARLNATTGAGYKYTAKDTIDVLVSTGPATGATSGTVSLTVLYTMDP